MEKQITTNKIHWSHFLNEGSLTAGVVEKLKQIHCYAEDNGDYLDLFNRLTYEDNTHDDKADFHEFIFTASINETDKNHYFTIGLNKGSGTDNYCNFHPTNPARPIHELAAEAVAALPSDNPLKQITDAYPVAYQDLLSNIKAINDLIDWK